nr:unnamed protein product [Digitaria exilis]
MAVLVCLLTGLAWAAQSPGGSDLSSREKSRKKNERTTAGSTQLANVEPHTGWCASSPLLQQKACAHPQCMSAASPGSIVSASAAATSSTSSRTTAAEQDGSGLLGLHSGEEPDER